jgi:V/A-type H+-transporting ATPase subunit E
VHHSDVALEATTVNEKEAVVEELQSLLDRIQREGVEQAEAQAASILAEARQKAQEIVADAKLQADETVAAGDRDAKLFMDRATVALEHTARDFLLQVQRSLEALFMESVRGELSAALTPDLIAELVAKLVASYGLSPKEEHHIDVRLSPADREAFVKLFMGKYRSMIAHGVDIHADERVRRGFRISFEDGHVYHDFTVEALAETLATMLRPPLKEIVRRAAAPAVESTGS